MTASPMTAIEAAPEAATDKRLHETLSQAFAPTHLEVIDESHMHASGPSAQSHFYVVIVSARFEGCSPVKRHQLVYTAVADFLGRGPKQGGIHALAITSRTPGEWAVNPTPNSSPVCASKARPSPVAV